MQIPSKRPKIGDKIRVPSGAIGYYLGKGYMNLILDECSLYIKDYHETFMKPRIKFRFGSNNYYGIKILEQDINEQYAASF